jgi:hypothetical protein
MNAAAMLGTAKVAARVKALVDSGAAIDEAIDTVCGAGTYDSIADAIWESARAAQEAR